MSFSGCYQNNSEKSIQEAEVLYQEATENETKGRELLASAILYTGNEADSVKFEGQALVDDAIAKRSQAKELEKDAYYSMNMARKELLAIEDAQLKSNLIDQNYQSFIAMPCILCIWDVCGRHQLINR